MMELIWLSLSLYRVSRLIARENGPFDVLAKFRQFLGRQATIQDRFTPIRQTIAELFNCPYCLAVWIAPIIYLSRDSLKEVWIVFAIAGLQTLLQSIEDDST